MNIQINSVGARWLSFTIAASIYIYMLGVSIPTLIDHAGGLVPFDMRPEGYDLAEAMQLLQALGLTGRHYYLTHQLLLDIPYPFFLTLFVWQMLTLFASQTQGKLKRLFVWAARVAPLIMVCDYTENILIAVMLQTETPTSNLVTLASMFSRAKAITTTLVLVILMLSAVNYFWTRWRRQIS